LRINACQIGQERSLNLRRNRGLTTRINPHNVPHRAAASLITKRALQLRSARSQIPTSRSGRRDRDHHAAVLRPSCGG
jgi:hypothetical protein